MNHSRYRKQSLLTIVTLLLVGLAIGVHATENGTQLSPKGIYHAVDEYQRTGIKFLVELQEYARDPRFVPVTHNFATGDRFTFRFEINRDTYIYVINQTLRDATTPTGMSSAGLKMNSKGIERVPEPSPPAPELRSQYAGKPRLLFPTTKAGTGNRLRKDRTYPVPQRGHYVMDNLTGTEKLYVVISDRPLDLGGYFHRDSGRVRSTSATDRLRRQLAKWKKNAVTEFVDKNIVHDVASYGVSIDPNKPAVVEIDLQHCR